MYIETIIKKVFTKSTKKKFMLLSENAIFLIHVFLAVHDIRKNLYMYVVSKKRLRFQKPKKSI